VDFNSLSQGWERTKDWRGKNSIPKLLKFRRPIGKGGSQWVTLLLLLGWDWGKLKEGTKA